MKKLKEKNNNLNNLLDYKHFLKNNNLKNNKFQKKLFTNSIFLESDESILIEFNKYKNLFLPIASLIDLNTIKEKIIYTIQNRYKDNFLFNYNFNYNTLLYFSKLIYSNLKQNKIKGRIMNKNRKKSFVSIFGYIFSIKLKNLHKNKRIFYGSKFKSIKRLNSFKLRSINFNLEKNWKKKSFLSRKTYVQEIIEKKQTKFQEKNKIKFKI